MPEVSDSKLAILEKTTDQLYKEQQALKVCMDAHEFESKDRYGHIMNVLETQIASANAHKEIITGLNNNLTWHQKMAYLFFGSYIAITFFLIGIKSSETLAKLFG